MQPPVQAPGGTLSAKTPPGDRKAAVLANSICVLFWGFSFISIKITVSVFPPMTLGAVRFAIAIVLLFVMYRLMEKPDGRRRGNLKKDLPFLAGSGLAGVTFYFFCENNGVALVTASEASLIVAVIPVLTMIAEWCAAKLRHTNSRTLERRHWLGAFISVAGITLVVQVSFAISGNISGYLFMGGAALCWVLYGFLTKPLFSRNRSRIYIVFWQNFFGFLGFLPFTALEYKAWGTPNAVVILHVLFLAICCSALGYWLYAHALKVLGISVSAVFINLIPVVTVIAGFFIRGERLSGLQWAGAALVLMGVYLAVLPKTGAVPVR
ncbi:MAG: DMT family transporter [Spirochaetaceae bacterium]|jgi:drug/metabolite transporter (DMT)-like permease|nr:DMT family transporter [Spirochaetaceae bacterium]